MRLWIFVFALVGAAAMFVFLRPPASHWRVGQRVTLNTYFEDGAYAKGTVIQADSKTVTVHVDGGAIRTYPSDFKPTDW